MHSKEKLALALEAAGLEDMAGRARSGYYHDYESPLSYPSMALAHELTQIGTPEARKILELHKQGEFDATLAESEEWAQGDEGRAAFERLAKGD